MKTPVIVDGVELATVIEQDDGRKECLWKVYGPQPLDAAIELCSAILAACGATLQPVSTAQAAPAAPAAKPAKGRNYTKAIREEIAKGLSDDQIFDALAEEFSLTPDKKYRIKEVRAELAKAAKAEAVAGDTPPPAAETTEPVAEVPAEVVPTDPAPENLLGDGEVVNMAQPQ